MWREYGVTGWVGEGEDGEERRGVVGREKKREERAEAGGSGDRVGAAKAIHTITSTLPSPLDASLLDVEVSEPDVTYVASNLPVSSVSRISIGLFHQ